MSTAFKKCVSDLEALSALLTTLTDAAVPLDERITVVHRLEALQHEAVDLMAPLKKRAAETVPERKVSLPRRDGHRPSSHLQYPAVLPTALQC